MPIMNLIDFCLIDNWFYSKAKYLYSTGIEEDNSQKSQILEFEKASIND